MEWRAFKGKRKNPGTYSENDSKAWMLPDGTIEWFSWRVEHRRKIKELGYKGMSDAFKKGAVRIAVVPENDEVNLELQAGNKKALEVLKKFEREYGVYGTWKVDLSEKWDRDGYADKGWYGVAYSGKDAVRGVEKKGDAEGWERVENPVDWGWESGWLDPNGKYVYKSEWDNLHHEHTIEKILKVKGVSGPAGTGYNIGFKKGYVRVTRGLKKHNNEYHIGVGKGKVKQELSKALKHVWYHIKKDKPNEVLVMVSDYNTDKWLHQYNQDGKAVDMLRWISEVLTELEKRKNPVVESMLGGMAAGAAAGLMGAYVGSRMARTKNGKECKNPGEIADYLVAWLDGNGKRKSKGGHTWAQAKGYAKKIAEEGGNRQIGIWKFSDFINKQGPVEMIKNPRTKGGKYKYQLISKNGKVGVTEISLEQAQREARFHAKRLGMPISIVRKDYDDPNSKWETIMDIDGRGRKNPGRKKGEYHIGIVMIRQEPPKETKKYEYDVKGRSKATDKIMGFVQNMGHLWEAYVSVTDYEGIVVFEGAFNGESGRWTVHSDDRFGVKNRPSGVRNPGNEKYEVRTWNRLTKRMESRWFAYKKRAIDDAINSTLFVLPEQRKLIEVRKYDKNGDYTIIDFDPDKKYRNPGNHGKRTAEAMSESFHGRPVKDWFEFSEQFEDDDELAILGILTELEIRTEDGKSAVPLEFTKSGKKNVDPKRDILVCTNPEGTQLYFVGGDQDLEDAIEEMKRNGCLVEDRVKKVNFGHIYSLSYYTDKHHLEGPDQTKGCHYIHKLGEESGIEPQLVWDKKTGLMEVIGGDYEVRDVGIWN